MFYNQLDVDLRFVASSFYDIVYSIKRTLQEARNRKYPIPMKHLSHCHGNWRNVYLIALSFQGLSIKNINFPLNFVGWDGFMGKQYVDEKMRKPASKEWKTYSELKHDVVTS